MKIFELLKSFFCQKIRVTFSLERGQDVANVKGFTLPKSKGLFALYTCCLDGHSCHCLAHESIKERKEVEGINLSRKIGLSEQCRGFTPIPEISSPERRMSHLLKERRKPAVERKARGRTKMSLLKCKTSRRFKIVRSYLCTKNSNGANGPGHSGLNCNNVTNTYSSPGHLPATKEKHNKALAEFLKLLLLRGGDVEEHPGPGDVEDRNQDNHAIPNRRTVRPSISLLSYNVRGLGDEKKLRHLLNHCYKQQGGPNMDFFCFLQETYVASQTKLPYMWRGNFHLTPGNGHSCGCVTLLSHHINITETRELGERGHILACQKSGERKASYILANVYAPNSKN